jgi:hypothetical protein
MRKTPESIYLKSSMMWISENWKAGLAYEKYALLPAVRKIPIRTPRAEIELTKFVQNVLVESTGSLMTVTNKVESATQKKNSSENHIIKTTKEYAHVEKNEVRKNSPASTENEKAPHKKTKRVM